MKKSDKRKITLTCVVCALLSVPVFAQSEVLPVAPPPAPVQEPAGAAPIVQQERANIVVRQLSSIEFGAFAAEYGGGSVTISPTGTRSGGGGVSLLNTGFYGAAEYEITGQPDELVIIYLPERVTLGKNSGSGGAAITNLKALPEGEIKLDNLGKARVKVGGTLQVPGNIPAGAYDGMFNIDVRYLN